MSSMDIPEPTSDAVKASLAVDFALESWEGWVDYEAVNPEFCARNMLREFIAEEVEYGHLILTALALSDELQDRIAALDALERFVDVPGVSHRNTMPVLKILQMDTSPSIREEAFDMTRYVRHGEGHRHTSTFTVADPYDCGHEWVSEDS